MEPFDDSSNEYDTSNYELVTENIYKKYTDYDDYDLAVNRVTELGENHFLVEAYLMQLYEDTNDEFKHKFKSYVENSSDYLNVFWNNSKIVVNLVNATSNEFRNETLICFELITTNIEIKSSDLSLKNETTFDTIFDFFKILDFEALHNDNNETKHEIADRNEIDNKKKLSHEITEMNTSEPTAVAEATDEGFLEPETSTADQSEASTIQSGGSTTIQNEMTNQAEDSTPKFFLKHLIPSCIETPEVKSRFKYHRNNNIF